MKVIYVAGKFRGHNAWEIEQNIRKAEEVALQIWQNGAACICPHANTRFFDGVLPDKTFLDGDLDILVLRNVTAACGEAWPRFASESPRLLH